MNDTANQEAAMQARMENLVTLSAITMTIFSSIALVLNIYLVAASRFLRKPIKVNLRLCVSLSGSDAACALCYILTYLVNIFFSHFSNCASLLLEVFKMATFTSSVVTLLALALNHYIGIVYPLHRNMITQRTVKCVIVFSYIVPLSVYLALFIIFPGGLRAPPAFAFFDPQGCRGNAIYRNPVFRVSLVAPFIIFISIISFLYFHILMHMRNISRDPLLSNNKSKRNNRKLLITLMLLAGSACLGWLPTSTMFVMPLVTPLEIPQQMRLLMGIIAQILHVSKLIMDAFIYASRLIEVRYSMWVFNYKVRDYILGKLHLESSNKPVRPIPKEFIRYLSETKENRSMRSKRVRSEFESSLNKSCNNSSAKCRMGSEKSENAKSTTNNNNISIPNVNAIVECENEKRSHKYVKLCKSVPSDSMENKKQKTLSFADIPDNSSQ